MAKKKKDRPKKHCCGKPARKRCKRCPLHFMLRARGRSSHPA